MSSVTVVGSVNLDMVATCPWLPKPGETITATAFARYPGGKGANQALAARRAGAAVTLVAAVGKDAQAEEATLLLRRSGVDLSRLVKSDRPTGAALITVDPDGENQIVVVPGANHDLRPEHVDPAGSDVVLCQLEIPMETVEAAAERATGLFCVNAAPAASLPSTVLERADLVIVNETEQSELSDDLTKTSALVVVTLGGAGAKAYRGGRSVAEVQPPQVEPVDTVGAGDAFCGALVTALGDGLSVTNALEWATAAGALATTAHGAQPSLPTRDEIQAVMNS